MPGNRFEGKTALITGGSSGMGFATAALLLGEGGRVAITGRNSRKLDRAAAELNGGDRLLPFAGDAASLTDTLMQTIQQKFGHLDIFFANVGVGRFKPFMEFTEEDFDLLVGANFKGVFFTVQKVLPTAAPSSSTPRGRTTEGWGRARSTRRPRRPWRTSPARLRRSWRRDGSASTPSVRGTSTRTCSTRSSWEKKRLRGVAVGRFGRAEEIANVVGFLVSSEASYMTGQDVLVDGGLVTVKGE